MKRIWTEEELTENWTLLPDERHWLGNKTGPTRLGFAVLLKFLQLEGRFPKHRVEISSTVVEFVARQVDVEPGKWAEYRWEGRTIEYHRAQIRTALGYREAGVVDIEMLGHWLREQILPYAQNFERLLPTLLERCRELRIEPPTPDRIDRLIRSATNTFEEEFARDVFQRLPSQTRMQLEALLWPTDGATDSPSGETEGVPLHELRSDPGRSTLETLEQELAKLSRIRALHLPSDLFARRSPRIVESYRRRVAAEQIFELQRHPETLRVTLLAAFCHLRGQDLVDTLVDVLLEMVHRISTRAERRVEHELIENLKRVAGKNSILYRLAEACLNEPDGSVRDVVYPIASEKTLRDLLRESKSTNPAYRQKVQTVIRNTYRSHYRRMLILLIQALDFRSNNQAHRPVLEAVVLIQKFVSNKLQWYPPEGVPLEGVVREGWQQAVFEHDADGNIRINRVMYEICVLQDLRERLRCKEVWVVGGNRYRNPDEDLPLDFESDRSNYYAALRLPQDARVLLSQVQHEMEENLDLLASGIPNNKDVRILARNGGWISLSRLVPQPEPTNLAALKAELLQYWPMTSLLDIFKESDLREDFTSVFHSATAWENLDRPGHPPEASVSPLWPGFECWHQTDERRTSRHEV